LTKNGTRRTVISTECEIGKVSPKIGKENGDQLRTVARSVQVLELVVARGSVTLRDAQRELGLGHTVAHRILQTWTHLQYLTFDSERKIYRAGLKLLWTGMRVRAALDNPDLDARLRRIGSALGLTANVGVLDGRFVLHVARHQTRYAPFHVEIGSSLPAHATSLGRILLAFQPQRAVQRLYGGEHLTSYTAATISDLPLLLADLQAIRERGYAVSYEMIEAGTTSIAVPLREPGGRVVAAMNAVGPSASFDADEVRGRILPTMLEVAGPPVQLPTLLSGDLVPTER
jgi:IclR family pca regulon transcriptional regulator